MNIHGRITIVCLFILGFFWGERSFAFTLLGSSNLVGWQQDTLTVKVNYSKCNVSNSELDASIDNAFQLWNEVATSGLRLVRNGESSATGAQALSDYKSIQDGPVIICEEDLFLEEGYEGVLGLGGFYSSNNEIFVGYILLNSTANNWDYSTLSNLIKDLVITHEMGHVMGLGHSNDKNAIMYYAATEKNQLSLGQDDVDAITYLYPRNELGENKVFGCGTVSRIYEDGKNNDSPPWSGIFILSLIFLSAGVSVRLSRVLNNR